MDPTVGVLIGAAIGAVGAIVGGVWGARFITSRDDRRRRREHEAAVRAVLQELAANLATFSRVLQQGSPRYLAISRVAYEGLLLPLYWAELPDRVATQLGKAYGLLALIDKLPNASWDLMQEAEPDCKQAQSELLDSAKTKLGMKF
jgi:hypothetical protein